MLYLKLQPVSCCTDVTFLLVDLPLGTRRVRTERDKGYLRGPCRFSVLNMELIRGKFRERVWLVEEQGGRHTELVRKLSRWIAILFALSGQHALSGHRRVFNGN